MPDQSGAYELTSADYERLVGSLRYCVLVHDAVTKDILWANRAASELLEFTVEELRPLKAPDMSVRADCYRRSAGRQWLQDAVDNGVAVIEWGYRSKSGREILTEAIAIRVELTGRTVVMVQFRDIEQEAMMRRELTRTEADLNRTEARLAAFLRNMAEGILVLDDDSRISYASEAAAKLLDVPVELLIGVRFTRFCRGGSSRERVERSLARASADGESQGLRYEVELASGERRWHSGSCQHISIENDLSGHLLLFHDVTEHVRTEEEHRRDAQYLNYLARYNAMGDMAMAIAHELAQPLAAATNFIAGTQGRLALGDPGLGDVTWGLQEARKQLDRANQIVRSLREYVTQLEESLQVVDLNEIVEECADFVDIRARQKGVCVEYVCSAEPVAVECERVLTGQVLLNLCFNAIDEMSAQSGEGGTVRVRTTASGAEGVVSVEDEGKGLSHIPDGRVFDGAFSSKATGHGIGLALSHRIISRQGGSLTATEREPQGAVFTFTLPRVTAPDRPRT
ncbi:ATP-binding protein [Prescottella soli]|uniref:histidine kinase n=1 Tax=Prescottella soli TaxID=1543852 RepID=A0ABW9FQW5_9NOCA